MGGGWRICLHAPRGSGYGLPDAHAHCSWIQVKIFLNTLKYKFLFIISPVVHLRRKLNKMYFGCLRAESMVKDTEMRELSRITFVFETVCSADCKFFFMAVREFCCCCFALQS